MAAVQHLPESSVFRIDLPDGEEAVLQYRVDNGGIWDMYHTEVPSSQRGKGLGAVLAQAALSYVRSHHLKARLSCSYLSHYVSKHPEYNEIVTQ